MADSLTRSIILFGLVGALALILQVSSPSLPVLSLFLVSVALLGIQYTGLLSKSFIVRVGLALPVGLAIVVLVLLMQFGTLPAMVLSTRTSISATLFYASLAAACIHIYHGRRNRDVSSSPDYDDWGFDRIKTYLPIIIVFLIALLVRLVAQSVNTSTVLPDGALYYSAARSLALSNTFSAKILNDVPGVSPYTVPAGLIPHSGTFLLLGSFFSFGGVSLQVYKIMLMVFGSVLVFPACLLAKVWYGKLAWLPGLIIAVQPTLIFFSVVPFGPEILSVTIGFSGIAILEVSRRLETSRYSATILAGLLLGVSCITWEPLLVTIFLMGYALSLFLVHREVSPLVVIVLVAAIAGLGLIMLLSSSVIVYQLIFVTAVPIIAVITWNKYKQLSSFLWVVAIVGSIYTLWLARWYTHSYLLVQPLAAGTGTSSQFGIPQSASLAGLRSSLEIYWQLLQLSSLQYIVLLAVLSIIFVGLSTSRRGAFSYTYILTNLLVIIFFFTASAGFSLDHTATRFLIGTAVALIILGAGAITGILENVLSSLRRLKINSDTLTDPEPSESTRPKVWARNNDYGRVGVAAYAVILMIMVSIVSAAVIQDFSNGYNHFDGFVNDVNYPSNMGISAAIPWITKNTPSNATFLVTSGETSRVWAMALASRSFGALAITFKNGTAVPYNKIGLSEMVNASNEIHAGYIIMDPIMLGFPSNNLTSFYAQIGLQDVNMTYALIPANATLPNILNSHALSAVSVAYVSNDTAKKVVILKPITSSIKSGWTDDFTTQGEWSASLNGSITSAPGRLTLSAPQYSENVYAAHTFQQGLTITNSTFMIVKSNQGSTTYSGFSLQFSSGKSSAMIFDTGGVHAISLAKYAGEKVQAILLYNLLSNNASSEPITHSLIYNFVSIDNLTQ